MRKHHGWRRLAALVTTAVCLSGPSVSHAQTLTSPASIPGEEPASEEPASSVGVLQQSGQPSLVKPFVDVVTDLRRLPSWSNVTWLAVGFGAAAASHPADARVARQFSSARTPSFRPGAFVGATPVELSAAFATYAVARAMKKPGAMRLGSDLIRAQLVAQLVTTGLKQGTRRSRPDGGGLSFPSGHTAVTFASATVLQEHYGWKAGVPAYVVASYVAASRVRMKRHYLSDIAFGAAVGIVAGRTVTLGGRQVTVTPSATLGGGGISFAWGSRP